MVATLCGGAPLAAQTSLSIMLGAGTTSWSGPHLTGGKFGTSLLALSAERDIAPGWTARGELAGQRNAGDMANSGLFEQPTSVVYYRASVAAVARRQLGHGPFFVEGGVSLWIKAGCDVDLADGPGFFGGETVGCSEWRSDADQGSPAPTLRPKSTGANLLVGVGLGGRRYGALVRFEPVGASLIDTDDGTISGRALSLILEWRPSARR